MGHIYKRPESPYYVIAYQDGSGRIRRISTKTTSKTMARQLLAAKEREVLEARVIGTSAIEDVEFRAFAEKFLRWSRQRNRPTTSTGYAYLLRILDPVFGTLRLSQITTKLITEYQSSRAGKVKPATCNREIALLRRMFNVAIRMGHARENPVAGKVDMLRENNTLMRCLSEEDEILLLAACEPYFRPVVITALHTGLRKGELRTLRWGDVNLAERLITVQGANAKSGKPRHIPVNDTLHAVLLSLPQPLDRSAFVFASPETGGAYVDFKWGWERAARRSGLVRFRFHDLRHSFASRLVRRGVSIQAVSALLGHAGLQTTLRYAHLSPGNLREAVAALDRPTQQGTTHSTTHSKKAIR